MKPCTAGAQRGFTLLELSIVLALIAVVLGGGLQIILGYMQASQLNATVKKMDDIEKALLNYAIANNRIPCPSGLTQTQSSANYGIEAATPGTCYGATPSANFQAASGTVEGGIPTRTLRLTDDYMYDGWGRRFRYAVDPVYTASAALPFPSNGLCSPSTSGITVNDASGAARTTAAIYALISHGANGHGAYTSNGVAMNAGSVNVSEQTNCHCDASATATTYSPTYVEKYLTLDPTNALDNFDDIVTFKEGWQIQAMNYPLATSPTCVYVVDWNPRVQVFSPTSGTYLGQWGGFNSTANGSLWNPGQLALDAARNVYEVDQFNERVQKFDPYGNFLLAIGAGYNGVSGSVGSSGSGNGQFNAVNSVAVDSSGNIWTAEITNNRVQEFNSSGTFVRGIGAGYNGVSGSIGSSGSGHGQFKSPYALAFDNGGHLWVLDTQNDRLQEFNSSGTYMNQITYTNGSGNGQFNYATALAFDPGGNIWVVDTDQSRVEKLNSAGAWILTVGGGASCTGCASTTSCTCNSGSANGMFASEMAGISVDPSGNLWVIDGWCCGGPTNNRVQEFNSKGTWIRSIGGSAPYTCETSPSGSLPACTSGSGNGQFSTANGIVVGNR